MSIRRAIRPSLASRVLALLALCLLLAPLVAGKKSKKAPVDAVAREITGTVEKTVPLRTHSIYAPYVDSDLQNRWWDFGGSAIVNTAKHIRLTQDRPAQSGWLWSRLPLTANAFELEVEFKVDGKGVNLYGDGFALWLTRSRAQVGPVFGSSDHWDGFGLFFDTYPNARHSYTFPIIQGVLNDGSKTYDVGKDGAGQEAGLCSIDYRKAEVATKVKLTYFKNHFLDVKVQYEKWDAFEPCFTLWNVTLPGSPFVGLTAHTGDISDEHDIVSVSTSNAVYHEESAAEKAARRQLGRRSGLSMGFGFFGAVFKLLRWLAVFVVIGVGVIAFRTWTAKRNSKRF